MYLLLLTFFCLLHRDLAALPDPDEQWTDNQWSQILARALQNDKASDAKPMSAGKASREGGISKSFSVANEIFQRIQDEVHPMDDYMDDVNDDPIPKNWAAQLAVVVQDFSESTEQWLETLGQVVESVIDSDNKELHEKVYAAENMVKGITSSVADLVANIAMEVASFLESGKGAHPT